MASKDEYYLKQLYPFQNDIIKIVSSLQDQFYLTGGTCLSRAYINHRYSDDLDFFVNDSKDFENIYNKVSKAIAEKYDTDEITSAEVYKNLHVYNNDGTKLIIDFVNDLPSHFGEIINHKILGRIDSVRNIMSNKISALIGRNKAKDAVDLWFVCMNYNFDFKEIIKETEKKEANVEIPFVVNTLKTLPQNYFDNINWIKKPSFNDYKDDMNIICDDMTNQRVNSLFEKYNHKINQNYKNIATNNIKSKSKIKL